MPARYIFYIDAPVGILLMAVTIPGLAQTLPALSYERAPYSSSCSP
jgi:hypothetical protein